MKQINRYFTKKIVCVLALIFFCKTLEAKDWLEKKAEGWAWYEQSKKTEDLEASQPPSATAEINRIKKENEEALSSAILSPTVENVRSYLTLQKKWVDQSALFAENWRLAVLQTPALDESLMHPTNQLGVQLTQQMKSQEKELILLQSQTQYGLIFFFEGNHLPSLATSVAVKLFEDKYQWEIIPVSMDGKSNELFSHPKQNVSIADQLGVTHLPAIYLVYPAINQWQIVGRGQLSFEELEDNILKALKRGSRL